MLRFVYVVIMRTFSIIYFVPKMAYYAKHTEKYSEADCFELARKIIGKVRRTGRITTEYHGLENLPKKSGYIMFSNHQDRYDALGILERHPMPCSVLMDKKRSNMFIAKQFVDLLKGKRIEKNAPRQQIRVLNEIAKEVSEGRNYLIFPEGGYGKKKTDNSLCEFKYGCFYCAIKAKGPIVPVLILDSYKAFGYNSLRAVHTKTIFLPAIPYEEYAHMKAPEVCAYVKSKLQAELDKWENKENKVS